MKTTISIFLLFVFSVPLLAQNPVVTLPASTFYRGDAPGSYTVSCPAGTSAGVSALTKIADVPLLNPASTQYGIGVTFPWPSASSPTPTLTGTLPQSSTITVMGGNVVYNAGVLAGTAYCNNPVPTQTTATAFTVTLNGSTREEAPQVQARQTYALKANSIKLPQLGTTEQNTLPPQQAGNLVYNTDQQKLALRTDTDWQYIGGNSGGYQNAAYFSTESRNGFTSSIYSLTTSPANPVQNWAIPAGVTRFEVELWGGGAGGGLYNINNFIDEYRCSNGGNAGSYARKTINIVAGATTVSVVAGPAGLGNQYVQQSTGVFSSPAVGPGEGGDSYLTYNGQTLRASGGLWRTVPQPSGTDGIVGPPALLISGGRPGPITVSYGQRSSTEFIRTVQLSNGGVGYGTPVDLACPGITIAFSSLTARSPAGDWSAYKVNTVNGNTMSSFPGGGGGCGYSYSAVIGTSSGEGSSPNGAPGLVIIRW